MSVQKKGLGSKGRGLEALISRTENISEKGVAEIDINKISPNREQPRSVFDEEALEVVFLLFLSAINDLRTGGPPASRRLFHII